MSGSTGGDRIDQNLVEKTAEKYFYNILVAEDITGRYAISGSFNNNETFEKKDFGDIDLILQCYDSDKKVAKQKIIDLVTSLPDDIIIPFKSEKYKGKKYLNSGEIITVLYRQHNSYKTVQIDNIIATSLDEFNFKKHFLDLPAEKQGLMLGLIKTILIEESTEKVFRRLRKIFIKESYDGIYEFSLSSSELQLRYIVYNKDWKELDRKIVWRSQNWQDVENLLWNYNFNASFDNILKLMKKNFRNIRSGKRVVGLFNSMVTVKSGEVGTPKGLDKERNIEKVNEILDSRRFGK